MLKLEQLVDLKIDYAFKQLFGNETNKDITIVFLNAILQKTGHEPIVEIAFENIEIVGEYEDDKQSRLDILVTTNDDKKINVEIQFTNQYDMIKRSIYYWASIYRSPMQKRMSYKSLHPVITINLMNFTLFHETERFHTTFQLYEDSEKFTLTDVMEFHFIEIPKLLADWRAKKLDPWHDILARWLLLLGIVDGRNKTYYEEIYKELEEIAVTDEKLQQAFQRWKTLSMSQEEVLAYEYRMKQILDAESIEAEYELRKQEAFQQGIEKGIEKGLEEGVTKTIQQNVRNMMELGMPNETIMKVVGISEEKLTEIKKLIR